MLFRSTQENVGLLELFNPNNKPFKSSSKGSCAVKARKKLLFDDKALHTVSSARYKIVLKQLISEEKPRCLWDLKCVSLQAFESGRSDKERKALKGISSSYLRKCLFEDEYFSKVNKAIVEMTMSAKRNNEDRLKAISILSKVIESGQHQVQNILTHIDFHKFIHLNIYYQEGGLVNRALSFLQNFKQIEDFQIFLNQFVLKQLRQISHMFLTKSGNSLSFLLVILIRVEWISYFDDLGF